MASKKSPDNNQTLKPHDYTFLRNGLLGVMSRAWGCTAALEHNMPISDLQTRAAGDFRELQAITRKLNVRVAGILFRQANVVDPEIDLMDRMALALHMNGIDPYEIEAIRDLESRARAKAVIDELRKNDKEVK